MVAARVGEAPGGNRQAHVAITEINKPGHAFRGVLFGVILGGLLWAAVLLALL